MYNSLGQIVISLLNEVKESGVHKILFNASNLPSGIYYYKLVSPDKSQTKPMVLLK